MRTGALVTDPSRLVGHRFPPRVFAYTERDVSLYALGVGTASDAMDELELPFVFEGRDTRLRVLPTFAVLFPSFDLHSAPGIAGREALLLHGEHELEVYRPLPPRGSVITDAQVTGVHDKGSGALVIIEATSRDDLGQLVATNRYGVFAPGAGGFGGARAPAGGLNTPNRPPDLVHEEAIATNQALLYRLSGDNNPLHADPAAAAQAGFPRPILHGLCTFGFVGRVVLRHLCGSDPGKFGRLALRFAQPVFPGETLITEIWHAGAASHLLRCRVEDRDAFVITRGSFEAREENPAGKPAGHAGASGGDALEHIPGVPRTT